MMKELILRTPITHDEYVQFVYDKLDIQPSEVSEVRIPYNIEEINTIDWNIGIICGNSGCGKSSILNTLGKAVPFEYNNDNTVISQFKGSGLNPSEASELLFNVGLSSIPTWLRTPNKLSNGERYRLDIAMQLANAKPNETIIIDEWTSVVNRDVAKSMSNSIQKIIRKKNLKVIFASCHFDIIEWLQCDWIYNLNKYPQTIEQLIYADDSNYTVYSDINNSQILSSEAAL